MASLIDTNVLVYRYDERDSRKQQIAQQLLREHASQWDVFVPHQVLLEFVSVVTRPLANKKSLLSFPEAQREVEELLLEFPILYPNESIIHRAIWGRAAYQLSWYDAHLWAYAECYRLKEILSEDFEHNRLYGTVRVRNPFL